MEDESGYSTDATVQGGGTVRSPARKNINGTWNVAPGVAGTTPVTPEPEPAIPTPERAISTPPDRGPSADGPDFSGLNGTTPNAPTGPDFSGLQGASRLEGVHDVVQQADPDHTGKVLGAAKALGVDPAQVENNLPEAQKAVKAPSGEFLRTLEESYPGSTNWLKDPLNMAVAKDDLHNVKRHEDLVNRVRVAHGIVDHALMGFQGGDIGLFVRNQLPDIEADPNASTVEKAVEMAAGFASDLPGYALGGAVGSVAGPVGTMAGAFGYNAALKSALTEGIKGTDFFPKLYKTAKAATEASIVGAGAGAAGLGTRLIGQTLLAGANLTGLSALAARAGITYGAIGAEALTATGLQTSISEGRRATLQEQVTGLAQMFLLHEVMQAGKFFKGKPALEGEIQEPSKQLSAPEAAPIEGEFKVEPRAPAPEAPAETRAPTAEDVQTAAQTFRTQESSVFYDKLGDAVAESKTRERLKTAHSSLMDSITKGTGLTDVIIPREDFDNYMTSQGIDPEAAATELGAKETYNQSSGNVYVPISKYTEIIGGSPHWKGLAPDIKFNADHNTQRQEETVQAGIKAEMKALEEKRAAVAEGKGPPADSAERVRAEEEKALLSVGRPPLEAKMMAIQVATAFKTSAKNVGMDPYELYKRYPVKYESAAHGGNRPIETTPNVEDVTLHQDNLRDNESKNRVIDATSLFKGVRTDLEKRIDDLKAEAKPLWEKISAGQAAVPQPAHENAIKQGLYTEEENTKAKDLTKRIKQLEKKALAEKPKPPPSRLESFVARFADDKKAVKAATLAQDPKLGPYVTDKRIPGIGWVPNFAAEPTGVIGPARISQPNEVGAWEDGKDRPVPGANGKETDPLKWADDKYQTTKRLIEKHKEQGVPLTINTSSDLIARTDYLAILPEGATVNMYMLTHDPEINRVIFPGSPSRQRQELAVQTLREAGVKVNEKESSLEQVMEMAGGEASVNRRLGGTVEENKEQISKALGKETAINSEEVSNVVSLVGRPRTESGAAITAGTVTPITGSEPVDAGLEAPQSGGPPEQIAAKEPGSQTDLSNEPMKHVRFATPSGNIWVTRIEKDGRVIQGVGPDKEISKKAAASGGTQYQVTSAATALMDSKWQKSMLVVGTNNWMRQNLPFVLTQKYDVHLFFRPQSAEHWEMGFAMMSRMGGEDKFVSVKNNDVNAALKDLAGAAVAEAGNFDIGEGAKTERSATEEKRAAWSAQSIYRKQKLPFRDVLALEPYKSETPGQSFFQAAPPAWINRTKDLPDLVTPLILNPKILGIEPFGEGASKESKKALQTAAHDYVQDQIQGKPFNNKDTGWDIVVSHDAVGHISGNLTHSAAAIAFAHVDKIIESAIHFHTEKADGTKKSIIAHHILFAPLEMAGKPYVAELTVREYRDGKKVLEKLRDMSVTAVERSTGLTRAGHPEGAQHSAPGEPQPLSMEDFLKEIKRARHFPDSDSLSQGEPKSPDSPPRGQITFSPGDEESAFKATITFLEGADHSTGEHERFGHHMFRVNKHLAEGPLGTPQMKADLAAAMKWSGVKEGEGLKPENEENLARGYEQWKREGKAPTPELRRVFERFMEWLKSIYTHADQLGVKLTDEMRDYFSRWFASQEEIDRARNDVGYTGEVPEGTPPEVQAKLEDLQSEARSQAQHALMKSQMEEISSANREFLAKEKARFTKEATAAVKGLPLYTAQSELGGKEMGAKANAFLEERVTDKEAAKWETVALTNGFESGYELAKAIAESDAQDGFNQEVKSRVDAAMEKYAPLKDTDAIRLQALEAIHDEKMTELLALEHQILEGLVNKASIKQEVSNRQKVVAKSEAEAIGREARATLNSKPIKDASNVRVYITEERQAAVRVAKALKDKDFEKAAKAKREQMLNHALVREAMKNRSEVTKGIKAMTSPTMGSLEKMPYAFSRQTKDLLSRFSLAKKPVEDIKSLSMIADQMVTAGTTDESEIANATGLVMGPQGWAPESLEAFITRVNQENYGLELPAIALNGSEKEYKSLTMEEFRDVRDSVIAIDEVGKRFDKYLEAFDNASVSATGKAMRAGIEKNLLQRHARAGLIGFEHDTKFSEFWAKVQKISDLLIPDKINILTLSEALDLHYVDGSYQKNPLGLAKETIYRPIAKAYDVRNARVAKEAQAWGEVAARFYTPEEIEAFDKKREKLPELGGMAMDKEKLLALALNWGNETNRDRIRRGYGLTDEQVSKALERLDKRDMDFVQATWDHIDTFWPEVKALEMRVRGHDPRKVEAAPVETIHGTYRGGYYPIKYDFDKSADAAQVELTRAANFGGKSSTYAMTDRGHTKERVNTVKRPVRLSLNVVGEHIVDVVHDLTMREALIDVTRTLRNPDVKLSITNEIGVKGYTAINNWLKAVAGDQSQPMKSVVDRFADWLRFRTTLNSISFRAIILPRKLLVDLSNAVVETGSVPTVMRAIKNYWMNEKENTAFIASKSPMMAALSTMNERDLMDVQKQFQGKESGIRQFAFFAEYFANKWVAAPLWLHIYQTKLGEFGEKKAIELANETIIKTVGSGSPVNLVGAQRGSSLNKMMSMFYSFAATMLNRLWLDGRIAALEYAAGNRSAAIAILASAFASTVIVPKIIDSLFLELAHNTGARPTDWKAVQKRVEERMIMAPFEFFPVGRVVVHALASDVKTDFKISPVEDTITTIMNSLKEQRDVAFGDKHLDKKAMEHAAKVAAILVGSPQTLNNAVFNYWDAAHEGGASLWRDGILGQRRQKK